MQENIALLVCFFVKKAKPFSQNLTQMQSFLLVFLTLKKPAKNINRDKGDIYNAAAINPHLSTDETESTEYSAWEMLSLPCTPLRRTHPNGAGRGRPLDTAPVTTTASLQFRHSLRPQESSHLILSQATRIFFSEFFHSFHGYAHAKFYHRDHWLLIAVEEMSEVFSAKHQNL